MPPILKPLNLELLAQIARKLSGTSERKRDYILKTADRELSVCLEEVRTRVIDLCYSGSFLSRAGISYTNPDTRLIKIALAHYFLTNH